MVHVGDGLVQPFDHAVGGKIGGPREGVQLPFGLNGNGKVEIHGIAHFLSKGFSAKARAL